MNNLSPVGHNNPPDLLETIPAQYEDARLEAENWLDGQAVTTEDQMNAVDALRKDMRKCRLDLVAAQKDAVAPLLDATNRERDRWKPTIEDTQTIENGLVALVDGFKRELAAKKERAEAAARAEARKAQEAAERAAREANAANIEEQRAAQAAMEAAKEAQAKAVAASKDTVKGLKTKTLYAIEDHRKLLHWIAANDRDAMTAFIEEWARKNHSLDMHADGLRVWTEKAAY
jgi:chemotaxis protein histidine kinase CheA